MKASQRIINSLKDLQQIMRKNGEQGRECLGMKLATWSGARAAGILKARVRNCIFFPGTMRSHQRVALGSDRI